MTVNFTELELFLNQKINTFLTSIQEQKDQGNTQLIKDEVAKLAQELEQKGFSKEKLLVYLKEIFEEKNFVGDKYQGGKELIIETIKEELKSYPTKKELDTKTTESLKSYKNWEDTKKEIKPVVIENVKESYKPGGELLERLKEILGKDKFYDNKPNKDIPEGREGMYKDALAIAILERDAKKQVEAMDKWDKFFDTDHVITDAEEKSWWMKKYPANPDGAENVYKQALLEAEDLLVGSDPLTNRERETILKATMPEKIKEAVQSIPLKRKEKEWQNFFNTSSEIKEEWKKYWVVSGLTITQAETTYKNGWRNDPSKGIIKNGLIAEYVITETIKDKELKKTARHIKPLEHSAVEVEKSLKFIIKEIKAQTDLNKFPIDNDINGAYDEKLVPDTLSHDEVKKYREEAKVNLFKIYFQGENPTSLSDKQIELWRVGKTGLLMNGSDQRKAYDNGWEKINEIKDGKTEYKAVQGINVLTTKKVDIDNEIVKVDQWINEIKSYTKKRQLDQKEKEINEVLTNLNTNLLPANKKETLIAERDKANTTLLYYADDPADKGLEPNKLKTYENNIKVQWKTRNYAPLNTQILENFINATKGIKLKSDEKWQAGNIDSWLKQKGAYSMDDTPEGKLMSEKEDKLPLELRGQFLLPWLMKKVKDSRGNELTSFDVLDENSFCLPGFREESRWGKTKQYPIIQGTQGHLPFATGSGKSTKVIGDLVRGGGKDGKGGIDPITGNPSRKIILVMPEQVLVDAIYKNQNSWMQSWGCVICGVDDLGVKVKKGTYTRANEEDIRTDNYEIKDIFKTHGEFKVVKNDLIPRGETGLSIITGDELVGWLDRQILFDDPAKPMNEWKPDPKDLDWFKSQEEIDKWKAEVQSKLIDREKDIIVFDECHYAIGAYQRVQIQAVHAKYKVIRMSATIPDMPFSITSTYLRDNLYLVSNGKLDPNLKVRDGLILDNALKNGKTAIFLPDQDLTPEQIRALKDPNSGLPVANISYTPVWDPYLESMSFGMPKGNLSILGTRHGVGITGDFDNVILSGKMYVKSLAKRFQYSKEELLNLDQADGIQMIGRTARVRRGMAGLLSLKWDDVDTKNDVQSAMVDAVFDGELKHIAKEGYKMLSDINMLRFAVALPKKFGSPLAEILIGLNVDEDAEAKRVEENEKSKSKPDKYTYRPLTKISWRSKYEKPKKVPFFGEVDEGLWKSYLGDIPPISMDKDEAKERLLGSINTFVKEDANFPNSIRVKNQSNLIEYIWGEDIKTKKTEIIQKVREVLNGVIWKEIEGYKERGEYDGNSKTSKDKIVVERIANYYKMSEANIDISMMPKVGEENKMVLTLRIEK